MSWWWCLNHKDVEPDAGCGHKDRLGPFATREGAQAAIDAAAARTHDWDEADEQWRNGEWRIPPGP